jgi:hypothetical protein
MFSHRRRAQFGLAGGLVVLLCTLTVLFRGSRDGLANWQPASGDHAAASAAAACDGDAPRPAHVVNLASLVK